MFDVKPCPFCSSGNVSLLINSVPPFGDRYTMKCMMCHAEITRQSLQKAIAAWQTRAGEREEVLV